MLPKLLKDMLTVEGVVAIATNGENGAHLVNTWHSFIVVTDEDKLLIPVGGMKTTEANLAKDSRVLLTLGSKTSPGAEKGAGFLIEGTGAVLTEGKNFDLLKSKISWIRAALEVTVEKATQTLGAK